MSIENLEYRPTNTGVSLRLIDACKLLIATSKAGNRYDVASLHLTPRGQDLLVVAVRGFNAVLLALLVVSTLLKSDSVTIADGVFVIGLCHC